MVRLNDLLEPTEVIIWTGRPSENWEPPFSGVGRLFSIAFLIIFGFIALVSLGMALINGEYSMLTIVLLLCLYFGWKKVNSLSNSVEQPKEYMITNRRVFFPDDYKGGLQYQSIPLPNLEEVKIVRKDEFIDVIFREEIRRTKGQGASKQYTLTYGFKGLEAERNPEAELRNALAEVEAPNVFFSYKSK